MANFPVFPSSDKAKSMANDMQIGQRHVGFTEKYPWKSLEVGTSFHIPTGNGNFRTIQNSCYKWSKKLKRVFRAIDYGEEGIEVARLPDKEVKNDKTNLQFFSDDEKA